MGYPPQGDAGVRLTHQFDANTILKADTDNTPEALAIAESRIVGRIPAGEVSALTQAQVEAMLIDGRYGQVTFAPNFARIIGQTRPTLVSEGLFYGFSLPVYNNDQEEVPACACVKSDWNATSDLTVFVGGWLTDANDAKRFNLQVSWNKWTSGDAAVPATSHDVEVETLTSTWGAKRPFKIAFTIDYDIDTPDNLAVGDGLGIRVRRLAASANEIAGEVVVEGAVLYYPRGSFGAAIS